MSIIVYSFEPAHTCAVYETSLFGTGLGVSYCYPHFVSIGSSTHHIIDRLITTLLIGYRHFLKPTGFEM